jgi:hypothetical protein
MRFHPMLLFLRRRFFAKAIIVVINYVNCKIEVLFKVHVDAWKVDAPSMWCVHLYHEFFHGDAMEPISCANKF